MSLFWQGYTLIYLKRQSLEIYLSGHSPLILNFPNDVVLAEEILDPNKFQSLFIDFLAVNKIVIHKTVIVLAEELVFQKDITQKDELVSQVPFPVEKVLCHSYVDQKIAVCINNESIKLLGEKLQIDFVVPQTLLGIPLVDINNYRQILKNKKLLRQLNLLNTIDTNKNIHPVWPTILLVIILLTVVAGGFYYLKTSKSSKDPKSIPQEILSTLSPTPQATVSASPTINTKTPKDILIKVVNGTGTPGDAKKVKDALLSLGFQNIETANLDLTTATASSVTYTSSGLLYLNQISTTLEKIFQVKPITTATDSASLDILIVTGK